MSGYIGTTPVPQSTQSRQSFTATASQTTFNTSGYTAGFVDVYLNGVKLVDGTDFTATNGSDVVLTVGASASDVVDIVMFGTFEIANTSLTDATINDTLTLKNATEEDTDGGRESTIIFKGEQSGGEISTLAEIEASHDGASDDEKGDLIFRTNDGNDGASPTEAMRITSAQKIGVGTSDPLGEVTIAKDAGGNAPTSVTAANTYLQLGSDDFGPSNNGKFMIGFGYTDAVNTNSPAYIGFEETSTSGDTKGALTFYTRDVVTDTAPTERMRILPAGGITFNGDTAAANALDDYEEGTCTIQIDSSGTHPTFSSGGTFTAQYRKVGKLVHVNGYSGQFIISSVGTGIARISGLPFAQSSTYGVIHFTHQTAYGTNVDHGYIETNQSYAYPIQSGSTTGVTYSTGSKYLMFSATYNSSG